MNPIDNIDATFAKNAAIGEKYKLQFAGRFYNFFNHPQYVGGYISDVAPIGFTSAAVHNFTIPSTAAVQPGLAGVFEQSAQHHCLRQVHLLGSGASGSQYRGSLRAPLFYGGMCRVYAGQ